MDVLKNTDSTRTSQGRLKVLHVAWWYPSERNPVAGVFVQEHVRATALYNDVIVVTYELVDKGIAGLYQIRDGVENGIRTIRILYKKPPIPKTSTLIYLHSIYKTFKRLQAEGFLPDVIHAHVYNAGIPAVFLGKRYGIPVVITEHSSAFPRGLIRSNEAKIAKFAFENADYVCPVCDYLKEHIESYGIKARFKIIPNAVDTSLFTPPKSASTGTDGKKHILLVALMNQVKGIPHLLDAVSHLIKKRDDFTVDILGDGPNRREYEKLAQSLGLHGFVHFHGLKTKKEVAEYMRKADLFVLTSLWENLPCVIIEAMASGLPIVATRVGGIPEMVDDEVGILVTPGDSQALAQALDEMLDNCHRYERESIAGKAKLCYSHETIGLAFHELYMELKEKRIRRQK